MGDDSTKGYHAIRFQYAVTLLLTLLALSSLFGTPRAWGAEISYVYDSLGRLRAVIDPISDTAVYNYDAVENLLSITRQSSSLVSIIEFTPDKGPVGTIVTIFGTGFSTTPSQNTVTFNGVVATVTSSTATQIVTSVPVGATTGLIGVTTPGGAATSALVFTVTSSTGAPTITGFTPTIGVAGSPVTVTGANFETAAINNHVKFNTTRANVSSSTTTSIATSVPNAAGSGRIAVSTPFGSAVSAADFFIPPSPYTAADVEPTATGRMTIGGASHAVTINTANKIALIVFDGTAGQKINLGVDNSTLPGCCHLLRIYKPDNTVLVSDGNFFTGTNLNATLPVTGTYTIFIDPAGTSTGTITLTLSEELNAGTIAINGASVTVTIGRVGQRARLTFSGTAGQKVGLGVNDSTFVCCGGNWIWIEKPDGTTLVGAGFGTGTNLDATLPVTGTYTIMVDPAGIGTGSITLTLSEEINAGTIAINGASVTVTIGWVGQRARLTFSGTAGQKVGLGVNDSTFVCCGGNWIWIEKPDGTTLVGAGFGTGTNLDATLPVTGTYTIMVDPAGIGTGSITLTLSEEINAGTITINGTSVTVTIGRVGQRAYMTFSGTAAQPVTLVVNNSTLPCCGNWIWIEKPDGTTLVGAGFGTGTTLPATLPVTGTYRIMLDPSGTNTGSVTVSLTSP